MSSLTSAAAGFSSASSGSGAGFSGGGTGGRSQTSRNFAAGVPHEVQRLGGVALASKPQIMHFQRDIALTLGVPNIGRAMGEPRKVSTSDLTLIWQLLVWVQAEHCWRQVYERPQNPRRRRHRKPGRAKLHRHITS